MMSHTLNHRRSLFTLTGLVCLLLFSGGPSALAQSAKFDHAALALRALQQHIQPGYKNFTRAASALQASLHGLCSQPGPNLLMQVHRAFRAAIVAWGRIEHLRFGAVVAQSRYERIFFWPDRKGTGRRQVVRALKRKSPALTDPAKLPRKSAAMQGLPALEYLLYGRGSEKILQRGTDGSFRCGYALAVSTNVTAMAQQIERDWRAGGRARELWLAPGTTNPSYVKTWETTLELLKSFDQGLMTIRDRRIAPPLGLGANRRRRARAILWRSKLSMVIIAANIQGLETLFAGNGLLADAALTSPLIKPSEVAPLIRSLRTEMQRLREQSGTLATKRDIFSAPDAALQLIPLGFPLKNVRANFTPLMRRAAGLSIGFNASDGD